MNVFLDSVGCRLNQSELELFASDLRLRGARLAEGPEGSDAIILNTCAVTAAAAADSRSLARRVIRRGPKARLILTGCWATLDPVAASRLGPGILVVPNARKETIVDQLLGPRPACGAPDSRSPIPGRRHRVRAFIKVQDGCSSSCAFCVTRLVRGPARSIPAQTVLQRVHQAVAGGAREIVLCGLQLGAYGMEAHGHLRLNGLIEMILRETQATRLRLSAIEPWHVNGSLLDMWRDPRLCRQLHIPLQSGCAGTLVRMRRPISPATFSRLVASARERIPGLAVTTDLIAGFPGETEAEFEESLRFIEAMAFDGAHVFGYSHRPGTDASQASGQLGSTEVQRRAHELRTQASDARRAALARQVGALESVLWVSARGAVGERWTLKGLTDTGFEVSARSFRNLRSAVSQVSITAVRGDVLLATVLADEPTEAAPRANSLPFSAASPV